MPVRNGNSSRVTNSSPKGVYCRIVTKCGVWRRLARNMLELEMMRFKTPYFVCAALALQVLTTNRVMAATIADARALTSGTAVTLNGVTVVNIVDTINSTNNKSFHLEDSTGGITIFGPNGTIDPILDQISLGDIIDITGVTGSFANLFQLQGDGSQALTLGGVTPGSGSPVPTSITAADLADGSPTAEALESRLAIIDSGDYFFFEGDGSTTFAGATNYTLSNGFDSLIVRIGANSQDLVGQVIPVENVTVTGIVSQFNFDDPNSGYQFLPRTFSDITVVPEPSTWALFACALFCLGGFYISRRRSKAEE